MKKLLFHLLIFTLFAAAAGCSSGKDDDGNPDVRFYAVPASLNFEAGKTTLQLSISTTGHWTIVCDDEWLEAVPAEGTGVRRSESPRRRILWRSSAPRR